MPFISKIQRQSDYSAFPSRHPIVIDNGGSYFRIGWAGESDPRVIFRNIIQRPRHKITGETITVVGDHNPALLKYFDCTRTGPRSAFDNNVVYQFEIMEYILDFGFDRLGADQSQIDHPVLITECACNPVQSRSKMAELLFESYGVPSVAFGVDAAFSYKYNQQLGICNNDGLAICSGFNTTHVIPFVNGEPVYEACKRTNVGGYHVTDYLKQLLSLKYPHHISKLTWEKVEDLKMEHCYIATDYESEVQLFQKGDEEADEKIRCWQLPWTPSLSEETTPSEEEIARKAALKEKQGQRLREMAEAKRFNRINDLENEIRDSENLLQRLRHAEEDDIPSILAKTRYTSKLEVESAIAKATQSLRKSKGEPVESVEKTDPSATEKYNLINVPDEALTPEQLKQKRKQLFIKSTSEARQQKKQKQLEEELERERQKKLEEEKRQENPEQYLDELRAKHRDLSEKVDQRKRLKTNGGHTNGNHNSSGGVGRGERLNSSQRERMRLLTTAAFDRGKGEDTFGMKDEDWQLYKLMSRDNDDDDDDDHPDLDEAELARVTSRLREIDPTFIFKAESGSSTAEAPHFRPLTKEDFQIILGVERFRCPEILFHPSLIGIEQLGLDEMAGKSIQGLLDKGRVSEERITNSILLTGGSCLFPGLSERLEAGIRMIRPSGTPIRIIKASNPIFDAWRGAAAYAAAMQFPQQTFSKMDYYEKGEDWLKGYQLRLDK
ncbi:Actin-related protein 5 [Forsythia ovata]|uniref:Actin-related protein 5 n=1 Tax=Forsythia ovata TaxID=205694 RepID=A0ABD1X8P0_9LAMI